MNRPLQDFSPAESNYERPTLGWVCGRESEGHPCSIGPSGRGDCQIFLECVPAKVGGGYVCARARAFGGPCDKGPLPDGNCCQTSVSCHPKRTLFARRRVLTTTLAGLALGVLLCTFGGTAAVRNAVTSPGELTHQHATIDHTCKKCHARSEDGFDALTDKLTSADSVALEDSKLCVSECHVFGEDYRNAHSLSADRLAALTEKAASRDSAVDRPLLVSLAIQLAGTPMDEGGLACSRCHKEHRGKLFDLTRMADAQCQVCHTDSFHSFKTDHPEFSDFPYPERPHIHFDHATHFGTHFANFKRIMPAGQAPESCETCHEPDPAQQSMPVVDYAQACGSCHDEQLENPFDAIDILTLPYIDRETLKYETIGEWPDDAVSTSGDGSLAAFMQLLLKNDADWSKANHDIELTDQDGDSTKAQEKTVWAIKRLMNDLIQNGDEALKKRLAASLGDAGSERTLARALTDNGRFLETARTASARWFPNLEDELARYIPGELLQVTGSDKSTNEASATAEGNSNKSNGGIHAGWTSHANTIKYVPTGHADPVVRALIEAFVSVPDVTTIADPSRPSAGSRMFAILTDPWTSFSCVKCHTVDVVDETTVVNWHGRRRSPRKRQFVRFSHAPHVTFKKCGFCHKHDDIDDRKEVFVRSEFIRLSDWGSPHIDVPAWAVNTDPHSPATSGFIPVERSLCAQCHDRQHAGESCVKCHNYHVGHFPLGTSFNALDESDEGESDDGTAMPDASTGP